MNGRLIVPILLALAIVAGAAFLGIAAYNAGVAQGVAQSAEGAPASGVVPYYGWHPAGFGFGFFGFLGLLLFIFLLFGLIRAVLWRGGPGRGGWGGPWRGGPWGAAGYGKGGPWETRAHEAFEDWHRRSHEAPSARQADDEARGQPT